MPCGTPPECAAAEAEAATAAHYDSIHADPTALAAFLTAMPKGGDLHNHLTGAVYAETLLDFAKADGDCINASSHAVSNSCAANLPVPNPGTTFYDDIVRAWSMKDFDYGGSESGHDHFFATFGKFGLTAGIHRNENLADIATRAASENQGYIETMFNMAKNTADRAATLWPGTVVTEADLPTFYAQVKADTQFAANVAADVAVVNNAYSQYRGVLGCSGANPPAACGVTMRFIAQVARTGPRDNVFGQLIGAYEMAAQTPYLVAANLSSPEDDSASLTNYTLHMKMLEFLRNEYASRMLSPLHITLHAGELAGATASAAHIRDAIDIGGAERIGHGLDVLGETDAPGLLQDMHDSNVLVEICMSSNYQILDVSGPAHPLKAYLQAGVPVALATDDQGVSRSSLAGEFLRASTDQDLSYLTLKRMARNSLEHCFLPGGSLWTSLDAADPVNDCEPALTEGVGGTPDAACQFFLDASERAAAQWDLESRFLAFEKTFAP